MSRMFVPGPVDVDPEVLRAQTKAMLPHRSKEFEEIFQRAAERAKELFYTAQPVFLATSSGTGMHEAAVRNFARESVLCCVNGAFAERWFDVAVSNGKQADKLDAQWNMPIQAEAVAQALRQKHYEILCVVHNETSTGLENPVREIAAEARRVSPDTLICVDAVSSLGGVKIEMDGWGLDMLLTSSQKCLALPPGLALAAASQRAMEYARAVPHRGWYFDLVRMAQHLAKDSTPATPALSLIYALDVQLERILVEGLEKRYARHSAMAGRVQTWALESGLALFAPEGYRSKTVTTIDNRSGIMVSELNAFLKLRGMRIAGGYGRFKETTFRIAHMGETQMADIEELLVAMDDYMAQRGA